QQRLHRRYRHLIGRGKRPSVAVVAVARELVGFVWAAMTPRAAASARCGHDWRALALTMRRQLYPAGRLAPLERGSSRRTTVMRHSIPVEGSAYISLIRRRRRLILRCASSPSGTFSKRRSTLTDPIRQRIHLTDGPSISVRLD